MHGEHPNRLVSTETSQSTMRTFIQHNKYSRGFQRTDNLAFSFLVSGVRVPTSNTQHWFISKMYASFFNWSINLGYSGVINKGVSNINMYNNQYTRSYMARYHVITNTRYGWAAHSCTPPPSSKAAGYLGHRNSRSFCLSTSQKTYLKALQTTLRANNTVSMNTHCNYLDYFASLRSMIL